MAAMDPGANRPFRYTGGINFDVPGVNPFTDAVDFASGGAGRGSMPFGDYPIMDYVAHTPKYGLEGFALNNAYGRMPDPKYPGGRSDIMLHLDAKGRTLDKLKSNGCLSVVASEWPALRDQIISLQKQGYKLVAHLDPDGNVTIKQADATSAAPASSVNDFISSTNQVRQDTRETQTALAKAGFDPGSIDGINGPRTKEAVAAFQKANGLNVDGIAGTKTIAALNDTTRGVGTPFDVINSAFPQSTSSDVASAYAPDPRMLGMLTQPNPALGTPPGTDLGLSGNGPPPLPQARPNPPSNPTHGQIVTGPDGKHYQYVQQTGGNGGINGTWGWTEATADNQGRPFAPSGGDTVRLASGASVAVGMYPSSDGRHQYRVTNDGQGNAVVTKQFGLGEIPGITRGINEPPGSIVGNYVKGIKEQIAAAGREKIAEATQGIGQMFAGSGRPSTAQTDMAPMSPPHGNSVVNTAADLTQKAGDLLSGFMAGSGLGAMFGGGQKPPPMPPTNQTNMAPMSPPASPAASPAAPTAQPRMLGRGLPSPPPVPTGAAFTGGWGAQAFTPQLPPMVNPQDAYANGVSIPTLPPALSAINAAAPQAGAPPVPMPGRPPALSIPTQPDFVQRMFLNTPIGKGLNALNGGNLGTYRVPGINPAIHARLMAQQSSDQRGQNALRAAGMLDQFGMIT